MKKIIALLLSLMLLLPAVSLAEATNVVDLGDFTITMNATDVIQQNEKVANQLLFMLYPDYDPTNSFHCNINGLWSTEDFSVIGTIGAETYGQTVLEQSIAQFESQNIAVSNQKLIYAEYDETNKSTILITSMDADYSGVGVDLAITLYQMQIYLPIAEGNSYIFTMSADSEASLEALSEYLNTNVAFK